MRCLWKILFFIWLWMQSIIPCHCLHPTSIPIKIPTALSSIHPHIPPKSSFCRPIVVMDALIRQMRPRSRAGGQSEPEDRDNNNGVSSQRTRSSGESWFQRQYSEQMRSNNNNHAIGGEDEIAIAIAAAAYAVNSLDESDRRAETTRGNSSLLARAQSKNEKITQQEPYNSSKSFSGQQETSSKAIQDSSSKEYKSQPKSNIGDGPVKTVRKRPTFAENLLLDRTESGNAKPQPQQQLQEVAEDEYKEGPPIPLQNPKKRTTLPPQPPSPPKFPATKPGDPPLFEIQGQAKAEPSAPRLPATELVNPPPKRLIGAGYAGGGALEADAWERDEMARIKVKHEKLSGTIVTWEDDKKKAARRKLDENEREMERRRAKALKEFQADMERIGKIAGGAKGMVEERRRDEELKAKEKAEGIRRRGKARSNACFCF